MAEGPRTPMAVNNGTAVVPVVPKSTSRLPIPSFDKKRMRAPSDDLNESQMQDAKRPRTNHGEPEPKSIGGGRPIKRSTSGSGLRGKRPGPTTSLRKRAATPPASTSIRKRQPTPPPPAKTKAPPAAARSLTRTAAATSKSAVGRPQASKAANAPSASGAISKTSKRAAWDYKGRLQDMTSVVDSMKNSNAEMQQVMLETQERVLHLEQERQQLEGTVQVKERLTTETEEKVRSLEQNLRDSEDKIYLLERKNSRLEMVHDDLHAKLRVAKEENTGLRCSISKMSSEKVGLESELSSLKRNKELLETKLREKEEESLTRLETIKSLETKIEERDAQIMDDEAQRKILHNTILELKGNIRVFCRVRPLLDEEISGQALAAPMSFPDREQKAIELEKPAEESAVGGQKKKASKYEFAFDRVFSPETSQNDVFDEISQLVQSALDGYNVCIFAYGQTGSGKTFTMEGPENCTTETRGMIPRAASQIFDSCESLKDMGWKYEMEACFLEIYNETIRDLLGPANSKEKHEIKLSGSKSSEVEVTNLTVVSLSNERQINDLLQTAAQNRAVAATKCNERSSRSHSVFIIRLKGFNELTGNSCEGTLNLVDLAGSERLSQSGSKGERLKETQNINRSLAELGNVIMALANKEPHIPYRNSKLTHLLQNSLGGNSKTLMFVNISPREESLSETLSSLRFATKVNQCNIGTAQKKTK